MGRALFIPLFILFSASVSFGQDNYRVDDQGYSHGKATIPVDQYLRFNDLQNLLIKQNIITIEDTLAVLAKKYPDYLRFHTLMYGSLSIQESSFEQPRAIVFGPDAGFIFTFNGSPNQYGGMSIESTEYNDKLHAFQFREIAFKKYPGFDRDGENIAPNEVAFENENLLITKPNPAKCLQCHGQNASPIWMTYFMWPGAYGSNDDQLGMSFDRSSWNPNNQGFFARTNKPSSQGRMMEFKPGMPDTELLGLTRYAMAKPNHPRYKWLPTKLDETGVLEYAKGVPFANLDFSAQAKQEQQKYQVGYEWPSRPNSFLMDILQLHNSDRLLARLEKEGLKGAFASDSWSKLYEGVVGGGPDGPAVGLASKDVIPVMAGKINEVLSHFKFKGSRPTQQQIEQALRTNLADEFAMQRERIYRQEDLLGKGSLQGQSFKGPGGADRTDRESLSVIANAPEFYSNILGLKKWNELDGIAMTIETDDQFVNTAVGLLLADHGIDLHDYNMNLRQESLAFHDAGLDSALKYLGVTN